MTTKNATTTVSEDGLILKRLAEIEDLLAQLEQSVSSTTQSLVAMHSTTSPTRISSPRPDAMEEVSLMNYKMLMHIANVLEQVVSGRGSSTSSSGAADSIIQARLEAATMTTAKLQTSMGKIYMSITHRPRVMLGKERI